MAAPIIGATKAKYLDDAAGVFNVQLTADEIDYLKAAYVPHKVIGAITQNLPQGVMLLDADKT